MIPLFPAFKKFAIEDKAAVEGITHAFQPYCEFSLVSLLTWYDIKISLLNNNLVLNLQSYYNENSGVYTFIGINNVDQTIETIVSYAEKTNGVTQLVLIPEPVIHSIKSPDKFNCVEDRDNFDYILSVEDISTLKGGINKSKRKLVNRFVTKYKEYEFTVIDITNKNIQKDITKIYTSWRKSSHKPAHYIDFERKTLLKLLPYVNKLNIIFFGLYYHTILIGFSCIELNNKPYANCSYSKTDHSFQGSQVLINKLVGEYLFKNNYYFLNIESDLGIPGLRNAKILYNPVQFLKKYIISVK